MGSVKKTLTRLQADLVTLILWIFKISDNQACKNFFLVTKKLIGRTNENFGIQKGTFSHLQSKLLGDYQSERQVDACFLRYAIMYIPDLLQKQAMHAFLIESPEIF